MAWEQGDDDYWEEQLPDPDPADAIHREDHQAYNNPRPWYLNDLDYTPQDEWLIDQRTKLYLVVIAETTWSHAWREIAAMNRHFRLPGRVRDRRPVLLPVRMSIRTTGSDVVTYRTAYLVRHVPMVTWSLTRDTPPQAGSPALLAHVFEEDYITWTTEWEARHTDIGNMTAADRVARRSAQLVNVNNMLPNILDVTYNVDGEPEQFCSMVHDRQSTINLMAWIESFGDHEDWMHVSRSFADRHFAARIEHDV